MHLVPRNSKLQKPWAWQATGPALNVIPKVNLSLYTATVFHQSRRKAEFLPEFTLANRGIGRDAVAMATARLDRLPRGPVFVMLGINDLQQPTDQSQRLWQTISGC